MEEEESACAGTVAVHLHVLDGRWGVRLCPLPSGLHPLPSGPCPLSLTPRPMALLCVYDSELDKNDHDKRYTFQLSFQPVGGKRRGSARVLVLQADNARSREEWVATIANVAKDLSGSLSHMKSTDSVLPTAFFSKKPSKGAFSGGGVGVSGSGGVEDGEVPVLWNKDLAGVVHLGLLESDDDDADCGGDYTDDYAVALASIRGDTNASPAPPGALDPAVLAAASSGGAAPAHNSGPRKNPFGNPGRSGSTSSVGGGGHGSGPRAGPSRDQHDPLFDDDAADDFLFSRQQQTQTMTMTMPQPATDRTSVTGTGTGTGTVSTTGITDRDQLRAAAVAAAVSAAMAAAAKGS